MGQRPQLRAVPRSLALIACGLVAVTAWAADSFHVRTAQVSASQGVYLLNAALQFQLPEGARQAVRDGVTLTLELQFEVSRSRNWWLDATVATLAQHYEISYHALSEYYLLRNLNSGEQRAYPSLDEALDSLREFHDLPVLDQSLIEPDESYELRVRALLDVRTLPSSLRMVLFWVDDWRQRTPWYEWPLKR